MAKGNQNLKTFHFIVGASFFIIGLLMMVTLSGVLRLLGFIIIIGALLYVATIIFYHRNKSSDKFKSNTREEILKYQHKR